MYRNLIPLLGLVALTGSACTTSGPPQDRPQQMVENREIQNVAQNVGGEVDGSPREVWPALQAAYDELELEVTGSDPGNGVLAARENRMRNLGGERNSHWVDCGDDVMGPVADKSFITFDVVSQLIPASATTTEVRVQLQARGRRRDNASGDLMCASRGTLELEIYERVAGQRRLPELDAWRPVDAR
jgi:hypothetical protein